MNELPPPVVPPACQSGAGAAISSPGQLDPSLSANLRADYAALQNDVEQANELAAEFQKQLAGKSNEFAHLKQVFAKTLEDLSHLQRDITALREERHRLANEAMKTTALQLKVNNLTTDRERLRVETEVIRAALMQATEDAARTSCQRDIQIAQLTMEVATLKQALGEAQMRSGRALYSNGSGREPKAPSVERLRHTDEQQRSSDDEFIDIGFSA